VGAIVAAQCSVKNAKAEVSPVEAASLLLAQRSREFDDPPPFGQDPGPDYIRDEFRREDSHPLPQPQSSRLSNVDQAICTQPGRYATFGENPLFGGNYGDPNGSYFDDHDIQRLHEHLFFCDNGVIVENIGYGDTDAPNFTLTPPGNRFSYSRREIERGVTETGRDLTTFRPSAREDNYYDYDLMQQVVQYPDGLVFPTSCLLDSRDYNVVNIGGENCQRFASHLREAYDKTLEELIEQEAREAANAAILETGVCGQPQIRTGGQGSTSQIYMLGPSDGTITIAYEMCPNPDRMDILYGDEAIGSTGGLVSGSGILQVPVDGSSNSLTVRMTAPNDGTKWAYLVYCPGQEVPQNIGLLMDCQ